MITQTAVTPAERDSNQNRIGFGPERPGSTYLACSSPFSFPNVEDGSLLRRNGCGCGPPLISLTNSSEAIRDRNLSRIPSGGTMSAAGAPFSASSGMTCALTCPRDHRNSRHESHVEICAFNSLISFPPSWAVAANAHISLYRPWLFGHRRMAARTSLLLLFI